MNASIRSLPASAVYTIATFSIKENKLINRFIEAYEILTGIYTKPDDEELNALNDDGW